VQLARIAAALAVSLFQFHTTDLFAQATDCADFKAALVLKVGNLKDGREYMQRVHLVLSNARMDDPRLNREVFEREIVRACEVARLAINIVGPIEKLIADNRARCPMPEIAGAEREFVQARSIAQTIIAEKKICK
jgi:hypothetical protein